MTLIAGKFGSGKSLLLLSLLGEVKVLDGEIAFATSDVMIPNEDVKMIQEAAICGVAYVPQVSLFLLWCKCWYLTVRWPGSKA